MTGQEGHDKSEMLCMSSQEEQLIKSDNDDSSTVTGQTRLVQSDMKLCVQE